MSKLHIDGIDEIVPYESYPDDQEVVVTLRLLRDLRGEHATSAELELARQTYALGSWNDIEIDAPARASRGDDGVWVQGWLFLSNEALGIDPDADPEAPEGAGVPS